MSSSLSALATATLFVASPAAATAITPDNIHRELQTSCTCSPQSYTFRLLLDNDCSSSTMTSDDLPDGIGNVSCMESAGGGSGSSGGDLVRRNKRRLLHSGDGQGENVDVGHYYYPAWNKGGYCYDSPTASAQEKGFETLEECCEL